MTATRDGEGLLETNPHEFGVKLLFTEYDLKPYFAVRSAVQEHDGGGSELATFEHNDRTYAVSLGYFPSCFAPREEVDIDKVYEYDLHVEEVGAPERKVHYQMSPRWANMKTTD